MGKRRTDHEWKTLFERYESSQLSQRVFCERHGLSLSTFYAKRQQLTRSETSSLGGFIKAEVIEKTTRLHVTQAPVANMTLFVDNVELSIPQGTPTAYLAELIGALS
ncbi:IS66 family insertion sequence element accessory protein TnpA [Enterovibrio norvegicus]|uniref:IS66 family insertion sequence element accessory protein TnpA n=1 Tax=Enterovibrio norvegicus TaxID=188144 RepID=UPI0024B04BC8|nr:IS66 family insertion sequence element accessory protein TnpB [Enterovibrio norvegicus]